MFDIHKFVESWDPWVNAVILTPHRDDCRACDPNGDCDAAAGCFDSRNGSIYVNVHGCKPTKPSNREYLYNHELWHFICWNDPKYTEVSAMLFEAFGDKAEMHVETGWGKLQHKEEEFAADVFAFLVTGRYTKLKLESHMRAYYKAKSLMPRVARMLHEMMAKELPCEYFLSM